MITNRIRKYLWHCLVCGAIAVAFVSCNDYLDTANERITPAHEELKSLSALRATTANLYAQPWYYFHKQRFIMLGDARANNLYVSNSNIGEMNAQATLNEDKQTATMLYAWGSLYDVITQADYVIQDYVPYCIANGICSSADANACAGEARFMRALAYWYLTVYWHDVPIVDDIFTQNAMAAPNKFEDVLQYAICDAEYAARWLPVVPVAKGRVSSVSAHALLSRLYITAGAWAKGGHYSADFKSRVADGYYRDDVDYMSSASLTEFFYSKAAAAARQALNDAPTGGYGLMDDYEQIFRVQNNNCSEVLFAIQTVASSTSYGLGNELQGTFCYDRCLDKNYGMTYFNFASYDIVNLLSQRGGLTRSRGNIMPHRMTYDYLYHEQDTCSNHNGGYHKGDKWVVTRNSWDAVAVKKQVVGGPLGTDNIAIQGNSGFCTPLLRMSEVYLNLTEALMGLYGEETTTRPRVLDGINIVRRRAYKSEIAAGTYSTLPGDYVTINFDTLLLERRMEFFAEGLAWSDIVRRSYMGDSHLRRMVDYQNNKIAETENAPLMGCYRLYNYGYRPAQDATTRAYLTDRLGVPYLKTNADGSYVVVQPSHSCVHQVPEGSYCHSQDMMTSTNLWSMIYPPTEVAQDANLHADPVAFDFTTIIANKNDYRNE